MLASTEEDESETVEKEVTKLKKQWKIEFDAASHKERTARLRDNLIYISLVLCVATLIVLTMNVNNGNVSDNLSIGLQFWAFFLGFFARNLFGQLGLQDTYLWKPKNGDDTKSSDNLPTARSKFSDNLWLPMFLWASYIFLASGIIFLVLSDAVCTRQVRQLRDSRAGGCMYCRRYKWHSSSITANDACVV